MSSSHQLINMAFFTSAQLSALTAFYNFSQQTTGKGMLCLVNAVEWMQGSRMLRSGIYVRSSSVLYIWSGSLERFVV